MYKYVHRNIYAYVALYSLCQTIHCYGVDIGFNTIQKQELFFWVI